MKKIIHTFLLILLLLNSLFLNVTTAFAYGTYQAATNNLGQLSGGGYPDYTKSGQNGGTNPYGLSSPFATAIDVSGHRLFVSDTANNRVILYNLDGSNVLTDLVVDSTLGQWGYYDSDSGTNQSRLNTPTGLYYDSVRNYLYVADSGNNRIMVFDVTAVTNGEVAVNVLGQNNYTDNSSGTTQGTLSNPRGLSYDTTNKTLFVADTGNNRVMVFDLNTITNGENAVNVIGQADFTSGASSLSDKRLSGPLGVAYDETHEYLYTADTGNNRVVVFDVSTLGDYPSGINVLGQGELSESNSTSNGQAGLNGPSGLVFDSNHDYIYVTDTNNNRVIVYDVAAIADGENAVNVLGQADYGTGSAATSQSRLSGPRGIAYDGTNNLLFVGDTTNNRVIVNDVAAITNGENAVNAIGESDLAGTTPIYTRSAANNLPRDFGFINPKGVLVDTIYDRLYVADTSNHRILIFSMYGHSVSNYTADYVLGQSDFITTTAPNSPSSSNLSSPQGMALSKNANKLFVADPDYNRVLVFDVASITNGEAAVNVLGQADFNSSDAAATQSGMSGPTNLTFDNQHLYVLAADTGNNRVLIYDANAISNGENAYRVVGQPNFTSSSSGASASTMNSPNSIYFDYANNRLLVADSGNHRALVFDFNAITNGESAANVLGQENFTDHAAGTTQSTLSSPKGIVFETTSQIIYVADTGNNRIMLFDGTPGVINDGENATAVWGYNVFTNATLASPTARTLSAPIDVSANNELHSIWVADAGNNRLLEFDIDNTPSPTYYSGGEVPDLSPIAFSFVLALGFVYIFKKSLANQLHTH